MIIQLGAVPKADKSIIIAVKCKAAYKRRMFSFPSNLVSAYYFQVIWSLWTLNNECVRVPVYASMYMYELIRYFWYTFLIRFPSQ